MASLTNTGIYLMDDGASLYLYVGSQVDPTIMQNLFGISNIKDAPALTEDNLYYNSTDDLVTRLYHLITELRSRKYDKYSYLYVVKEGERSPAEFEFYGRLIEDKMNIPQSYNVAYGDFIESLSKPVMQTTQQ
jgi:protein transport protein SEC24